MLVSIVHCLGYIQGILIGDRYYDIDIVWLLQLTEYLL